MSPANPLAFHSFVLISETDVYPFIVAEPLTHAHKPHGLGL